MALKRKTKAAVLGADNQPLNIDNSTKNSLLAINEKVKNVCKKTFDNRLKMEKELVKVAKEYRAIVTLTGSYQKIHMKYRIVPSTFELEKDFTDYVSLETELDSIKDKI